MIINELCSKIESMKDGLAGFVAEIADVEGNPNNILIKAAGEAVAGTVTKGLTDLIDAICESGNIKDICDTLAYISSLTGAMGNLLRSVSWLLPPFKVFAEGLTLISLVATTAELFLQRLGFCEKDPVEPANPTTTPATSPLIFDLNGDGVQTIALEDSSVFFDLNGDGFAQHTAWVSPEDGLLALDRNANGRIDDITELFGSETQDGFTQLRALDSNTDGVLDAADAAFDDLRLWIDANADGISQSDELKTLVELGIDFINLTASLVNSENAGNLVTHESTALTADGGTLQVLDVWFRNSEVNTKFILPDDYEFAPGALILPQLIGYGDVADLAYVMSENEALLNAVTALIADVNDMTGTQFRASFEDILLQWAGVAEVDPGSRGAFVDARHLALVERMFANEFVQLQGTNAGTPDPGPNAAQDVEQAYQDLLDGMMTRFAVQIFVAQIELFEGEADVPLPADFAALEAINASPFLSFSEIFYNRDVNKITTRDVDSALSTVFAGLPPDAELAITQIDLVMTALGGLRVDLFGGDGAAFQTAVSGALGEIDDLALRTLALERLAGRVDLSSGGDGADDLTISGIAYRDDAAEFRPDANELWGRGGDDTLSGGFGSDTYIFARGDGSDLVDDNGAADQTLLDDWGVFVNFGGEDKLLFVGRAATDATFSREGDDLVIVFSDGSGDVVRVAGQFAVDVADRLERIVFSDIEFGQPEIDASFALQQATSGDDDILGSAQGDDVSGGGGDDILRGRGGDDIYRYSRGDGDDVVVERGGDQADELVFTDIIAADVTVLRDGDDILITILDPLDAALVTGSIRLVGEFSGDGDSGVEILRFADGAIWTVTDLVIEASGGLPQAPVILGTAGADSLNGTANSDIIDGGAGDDVIAPGAGNDLILFGFGAGRDVLNLSRADRFGEANVVQIEASQDEIALSRVGDDLLIEMLEIIVQPDGSSIAQATGDALTVAGHFLGVATGLQRLVLSDGLVLDSNAINGIAVPDSSNLDLAGVSLNDLGFARVDAPVERVLAHAFGNTDLIVSANGTVLALIEDQFLPLPDGNGGGTGDGLERITLDDGTILDRADLARLAPVEGTPFDDNAAIQGDDPELHGSLSGTQFAEILSGFAGDDNIVGRAGDDSITGGPGDDRLTGDQDSGVDVGAPREGSDSYFYASGDGNDQIFDFGTGGIDVDRLVFSDLNPGDVELSRVSASFAGGAIEGRNAELVITISATGETITVEQQFENEFFGLEEIIFADGTVLGRSALLDIVPLVGTAGADQILGSGLIQPGAGDDAIFAVEQPGYDDVLLYKAGDGRDEIDGVEIVRLPDLNAADVRLVRAGTDLQILILATGQSILVAGQFQAPIDGDGEGGDDGEGPIGDPGGDVLGGPGGPLPGDPDGPLDGPEDGSGIGFSPALVQIEFADGEIWDRQRIADEAAVSSTDNNDIIEGTIASDRINAGGGDDLVTALAGNDEITGGAGNDTLSGDDGFDRFFAGSSDGGPDGDDVVDGGADDDRYDASATGSAVTIDLAAGTASGVDIGNDTLFSIEEAYGGQGDDTLIGSGERNILVGGAGDDQLSGGGGFDLLVGGAGADTLDGGAGLDVALYDRSLAGINVDLLSGTGLGGDAEGDLLIGVEDLLGSNYNDTLSGSDLGNSFDLNRGDDSASGRGGNDTINGDAGNDSLSGGDGDDSLGGGVGDDDITGGAGFDTLDGGIGNDFLAGGAGDDRYIWYEGAGRDVLVEAAEPAGDVDRLDIFGLTHLEATLSRRSNDLYISTFGGDELYIPGHFSGAAGAGIEQIVFVEDGVSLDRAAIAAATVARINATPFAVNDVFQTDGGVPLVIAPQDLAGNDLDLDGDALAILSIPGAINGTAELLGDGSVSFVPAAGFVGEAGFSYVVSDGFGGEATAQVLVDVLLAAIEGGSGNEVFFGSVGDDTISGGAGNDWFRGGLGADLLDGGEGFDTASYDTSGAGVVVNLASGIGSGGDAEGDQLFNIEGLTGSAHDDELIGSAANNALIGGAGNDTLSGGAGFDWLRGGVGADFIDGGEGFDTASYDTSEAGVAVDLASGTASGGDAEGDQLFDIEGLTGSAHDDALTGTAAANALVGGAGNDTLSGGDGHDWLRGGAGADQLDGGEGFDTASYHNSAAGVAVNLASGAGSGGDADGDLLFDIEGLTGSGHDDALIGSAAGNALVGGAGNDTISGGDGHDWMRGGLGADLIEGGEGFDTASYDTSAAAVVVNLATGVGSGGDAEGDQLFEIESLTGSAHDDELTGSAAANVLIGGLGDDLLAGGGGLDQFLFLADFGHDEIADFSPGDDLIVVSNLLLEQGQSISQLLADATQDGSGTVISLGAENSIRFEGVALGALGAGDFLVI